jgi:hypothetical protein
MLIGGKCMERARRVSKSELAQALLSIRPTIMSS